MFDGPVDLSGEGLLEFGAGITAIADDLAQPGIAERIEDRASGAPSGAWMTTPIRWPCVSRCVARGL